MAGSLQTSTDSLLHEYLLSDTHTHTSAHLRYAQTLTQTFTHATVTQEELVEVAGEREDWASLLRLLPPRPDPRTSRR